MHLTLALSQGAVFVSSGGNVTEQIRELLLDGGDVVFDLADGKALRMVASLVKNPAHMISAADPVTVEELGGRCYVVLRR